MKWFNIIGGILCAALIAIGQGWTVPVVPIPHVVVAPPLIDADGFYMLIVEEKDDRRNLPVQQASILVPSSQLTGWLADSKAQWRIFDTNNEDVSKDDPKWQTALAQLKRDSLPWIYIQSDRKARFSGPLPGSVDDTLALLKKYAPVGRSE